MGVDGWMDEGRKQDPALLIEKIRRQGKHENRWVPALMWDYRETRSGEEWMEKTLRQRAGHLRRQRQSKQGHYICISGF